MKNILVIFAVLIINLPSYGKHKIDTLRLSLTQAIEIGMANRFDLKSSMVAEKLALNEVNVTRGNWLPEITASGNLQYNTQLQETILPEEFSMGEPITLGTSNNTSFSIDLDQPLYQPTQKTEMAIAKKEVEIKTVETEQIRLDVKYAISEAYYESLLQQKKLALAKAYTQRSKYLLQLMEDKLALGNVIENEVLRQDLDYQNAMMKELQAKNEHKLAITKLKNAMQYEDQRILLLTENISADPQLEAVAPSLDIHKNTDLRNLLLQKEKTYLQLKQVGDSRKPTVSFYGNYIYQFQDNGFNYSNDAWSTGNYIGLKFSVPISKFLSFGLQKAGYQLQIEQNSLDYQFQKSNVQFAVDQALSEVINQLEQLNYARKNYILAQKIYESDLAQYDLGALLYRDLLDSAQTLNDSEQNLVQAQHDFQQAQLTYYKAQGI